MIILGRKFNGYEIDFIMKVYLFESGIFFNLYRCVLRLCEIYVELGKLFLRFNLFFS